MSKFSTYLRHPVARNAATFVQIFCAYHVVGAYLGYPQQTDGPSMLPGLGVRGEWLWVSTLHRRGRWVKVGDLVSVKHPQFPGEGVSKRVLGMPGDFVMRDTPESGSDVMIQVRACMGFGSLSATAVLIRRSRFQPDIVGWRETTCPGLGTRETTVRSLWP